MNQESLWLGPMRKPIRMAAIGFSAVFAVLYVWLIANRLLTEDSIGMYEMIRPEGRPMVQLMLFVILGTVLTLSLYLSDSRGAIEYHPDGVFDIISLVLSRVAMILVALTVLVMFYEVVSRYVFARPTLWANELSLFMASFVFLLAGLYAMQQRSHIRIYVIYDMMPRFFQKVSDIISLFLIWFFTFAMVWGGYDDAMRRFLRMETFGTAWDPPIPGILKGAILIIICLVALQALSNIIADWNKAPEHLSLDDMDEVEIENIRKTLR
ncbi:Tripartite ATP-independent periplasmic transporters, DctQ component [Rhodobacteraceae bacterium THAF1]|uniref:TRAP transporter small permease subunit n=1 Tax=Palleronia sp. THAF1 TaxID=2587842 RepID=UPI000F40507F|nr:TRAP transporter small permease [Palleronia sp. THAF1]QFU09680.1 Tripartite ATP-independent periplasmic transporter, DctQ component [Palleronia sp. THAF1]VDC17417.1 Tripartite ATP-independent periplasmic transporters, DctQ component [Rhodobacteraceae bacterium THAF1]